MKGDHYLFDTHAIIFWQAKISVSEDFLKFFDKQEQNEMLYLSSISFWEIAFLAKKGKIEIADVHAWKNELMLNTNIRMIEPSASEMIDSTLLPDHHKDPFDRLLITQANHNNLILVTQDQNIEKYQVKQFWVD